MAGLKHTATVSRTSLGVFLATAAMEGRERRHLDIEQTFVQATGDKATHIELPDECQDFPGVVGRLNTYIYGLVQASPRFNQNLLSDFEMQRYEKSEADPCVLHKLVDGETEVVLVVHVDAILASTHG